jgi:hypothetical protein
MVKLAMSGALVAMLTLVTTVARAQDPDEVARLRRENELLKKENELLKKEIELLKKEAKAKLDAAKDPKTEEKPPRTKAYEFGSVEYELVKCARDPKNRTRVTFTFAVLDEKGIVQTVHGCKVLTLTTSDGKTLDGRIVTVSDEMVRLTKGEVSKFQVTYAGVAESVTSFEEVGLTMGAPLGIPRSPLKFYRIKIEPK